MRILQSLGLDKVTFKIKFETIEPCIRGADRIHFLFSANLGEELAPLSEVASGGEMSRFLLALKTILSDNNASQVLFFDEIDAGVSGRVSLAIAKLLKQLSMSQQVFCITHQPLVAAAADQHFRVVKTVNNGVTSSNILSLSSVEERQNELVELAGGNSVEAHAYAASLLEQPAA